MKYTTVFLDLDDTIIDTLENSRIALQQVYHMHGISRYYATYNEFKEIYFQNSSQLWNKYNRGQITKSELLKGRFSETFRPFEDITEEYLETMNEDYLRHTVSIGTHISGAKDVLEYLKLKYQIVIISNGFTELQYKKIEAAGFGEYFDGVILSDKVGVNKPHPDIFNYALNEVGKKPSDVIMIGDNLFTDISGAYYSGIDQIWFNPRNEPLKDVTPTHVINTLTEIKDIL